MRSIKLLVGYENRQTNCTNSHEAGESTEEEGEKRLFREAKTEVIWTGGLQKTG